MIALRGALRDPLRLSMAAAMAGVAGFLAVAAASVAYPYDLGFFEGTLFFPALRLVSGLPTYGPEPVFARPYLAAPYGPAYYALLGTIVRFTGIAFWPGRALSALAVIATMAVVAAIVRRATGQWSAAVLAAGALVMAPGVWAFGTLQRVDALGIFWVALALFVLTRRPGGRGSAAAGGLMALAALTKATLVAGSVAAAIFLFSGRRPPFFAFVLAAGLVLGLGLALVSGVGAGSHLYTVLGVDAPGPYSALLTLRVLRDYVSRPVAMILVYGVVRLLAREATGEMLSTEERLFARMAAVAFAFGAATATHEGASINYFFEFNLAAAVALGLEAARSARMGPSAHVELARLFAVAVAVQLVLFDSGFIRGRWLIPRRQAALHEAIQAQVAGLPRGARIVISPCPEVVLRAGREPYFNDSGYYVVGPPALGPVYEESLRRHEAAAILNPPGGPVPGGYHRTSNGSEAASGLSMYLRDDFSTTPAIDTGAGGRR